MGQATVRNAHSMEASPMDFFSAVNSCLGQYATFSGRASRSEFWWFFLFQILAMLAAALLTVVYWALFLPGLAVGARRLHDIGRSGWWQLLLIVPILWLLLAYWWVQPH